MKKSSILTKILLSLVMVALVFALVACNGGGKNPTPRPTPGPDGDGPTFVEQVVEIVGGISPLLDKLNNAKKDGTLGVDVNLGVTYSIGETQGAHLLAVMANANAKKPEAQISYANGKTKANKEWFNLTYQDSKLYLVQPVTAVNTDNDTDATWNDLSAFDPAITDLMTMAMDAIEGLDISLPDDLADTVGEMLGSLSGVADMLSIQKNTNGYKLVISEDVITRNIAPLLGTLLPGMLENALGDIGATVSDAILNFLKSGVALEVNVGLNADKAINSIGVGYTKGTDKANLDIGLVFDDKAVDIEAPKAAKKALNIGAAVELAQKAALVKLEAFGVADFAKDGNNLAYAELVTKLGEASQVSHGYFNGSELFFNTNALGVVSENVNNSYKATIQTEKEGEKDVLEANSIVKMINKAAEDARADYEEGKTEAENADATEKTITQSIYQWLGGTLTKAKDGKYEAVTQQAMMAQLKNNVSDYVRFEIDDKSDKDNYFNTVKNILALFAENDTWIIGGDLVNADGVKALTGLADVLNFEKWVNKKDGKLVSCDGGIFNWDSKNYNGGVTVTKAGENNDFLDAVNVFAAQGKENDEFVDVDAKFLADFINYYIAALGYHTGFFTDSEKAEIDAIDMKLAYDKSVYTKAMNAAKDQDAEKAAKEAWSAAKKAHKEALKGYYTAEKANEVLVALIGGTYDNESTVVEQLINGGLYINIGSEKGRGLYGYIDIRDSFESDKSYAKASIHLNLVDDDVNTQVEAITAIDVENAVELYAPEKVTAEDADAAKYAVKKTVENSNVLEVEQKGESYEYVTVAGAYNDRFEAAESLLDLLLQAAKDYLHA